MFRRTAVATTMVIALNCGMAMPAAADGIRVTLTPRGEQAEAVRTGLALWGLARDVKNRARTKQKGVGNGAAIAQHGSGNNAFIVQKGKGNSGTITQNGSNNTHGLFQFGRKNRSDIVQNGNGNVGFTIVGRW
jgi:hypothetical protein